MRELGQALTSIVKYYLVILTLSRRTSPPNDDHLLSDL